jgi:two-component system, OmpR family, KDP operon response regulator KdpE
VARVLLIEDDASIAEVERIALEGDGYEVDVTDRGDGAVPKLEAWKPDLVILDLGLPDVDGKELITSLRFNTRTPIIVVTGRGADEEVVASLDLGADDYIVKPFKTPELMARVRAVLRRTGEPSDRGEKLEFKDLVLDERARRVTRSDAEVVLTRIEFELLRLLMQRPEEVVDREEMADAIWNMPAARIGKSLDVHMSVLRRKLGDDPRDPSYIHTVRAVGFRMAGS